MKEERRKRTRKILDHKGLIKKLLFAGLFVVLTFYFGGVLERLIHAKVEINPLICIRQGITTIQGLQCSACAFIAILLIAAVIIWRGHGKEVLETDEDRNFDYSVKGTYGTAGYMKHDEEKEILNLDKKLDDVK